MSQVLVNEVNFNAAIDLGVKHNIPSHKINNGKLYLLTAGSGRGRTKMSTYTIAKAA